MSAFQVGASTLGTPGEPLPQVIATLVGAGATCVELRTAPDIEINVGIDSAARARIRDAFAEAGIRILAVASGVRVGDDLPDDEVVDALVAHLELAGDLGAGYVRVFPGVPIIQGPFDEVPTSTVDRPGAEAAAAARLTRAARRASDLGVRIVLETHDSNPRGWDSRRILDQLGPDTASVGSIWDLLHPWRTGEAVADTWAALSGFILEGRGFVQIKDVASRRVLTPVLQGTGIVPLDDALDVLTTGGYTGPLSLEWERTWYPEVPSLAPALAAAVGRVRAYEAARESDGN